MVINEEFINSLGVDENEIVSSLSDTLSIPQKKVFHMTDLIHSVIVAGKSVHTYMVKERDYIDIGQWDEYHKAVTMLSAVKFDNK